MRIFAIPTMLLLGGVTVFAQQTMNPERTIAPRVAVEDTNTAGFPADTSGVLDLGQVMGSLNVSLTNSSGAFVTPAEVTSIFLNLQQSIEQALPLADLVNDAIFLTGWPHNILTEPVPGVGTSFITNVNNFGARALAGNANRSMALSPAGAPFGTSLVPGAPTPAGTTNGTVSVALFQDTVRALQALQTDLDRLLPIVAALNGVTNAVVPGNNGVITNSPGAGRGPALAPGGPVLTPTPPPF